MSTHADHRFKIHDTHSMQQPRAHLPTFAVNRHCQPSKTHAHARAGDKTPNNALIELQPVRVLFAKLQNAKLRLFTASTQHFSTSGSHRVRVLVTKPHAALFIAFQNLNDRAMQF